MTLFVPQRQESHRTKRVAESIRGVVAMELAPTDRPIVFDEHGKEVYNPGFLTITHVSVSPDLKYATIFIWPLDRSKEEHVIPYLEHYSRILRQAISKKLKLRYTPKLNFKLDYSLDEAQHIDNLLNKHTKE